LRFNIDYYVISASDFIAIDGYFQAFRLRLLPLSASFSADVAAAAYFQCLKEMTTHFYYCH